MDVAVARRAERPTWLNGRTLLGAALLAASLVGGHRVMEQANVTVGIWATTKDLPAGARLTADALRASQVRLEPEVIDHYVSVSESLEGAVLTRPMRRGELVAAGWLSTGDAAAAGRSITIPVSPEHALGGTLRPGDRVDVYATFDAGDVRARTILLIRDIEVMDVVTTGGLVLDERSIVGVTVSLDPEEAARTAFAIRTGEIDLVRVEAGRGLPPGTTVQTQDFR